MESFLTLINDVVDSQSSQTPPPSLNTTNLPLPQPPSPGPPPDNASSEIIKDGHEPFLPFSEVDNDNDNNTASFIKRNKDICTNTKKLKNLDNCNNISDSLIDECSSGELCHLEVLSPQPSTSSKPLLAPPSLLTSSVVANQLSVIPEQTEIQTTIDRSHLESRLLAPTIRTTIIASTLISSDRNDKSSSDGSVSSNLIEEQDLSVSGLEEKSVAEVAKEEVLPDSLITKSRHVNSNNRDDHARLINSKGENNKLKNFHQIIPEESKIEEEEESKDHLTFKKTNLSLVTVNHSSLPSDQPSGIEDISSILPDATFSSVHSDKSILGEWYSPVKETPLTVTGSPCPSPLMTGDRYPTVTPFRNIKDITRTSISHSRETRFPSPGTYFAGKSGPMGDISGGLSPGKRPRFFSPNHRLEKWPTPMIDTTPSEPSGRKTTEGWPTSPRRMQLGSPRFNSLPDLEEEPPENSDQGGTGAKRHKSINVPGKLRKNTVSSPTIDDIPSLSSSTTSLSLSSSSSSSSLSSLSLSSSSSSSSGLDAISEIAELDEEPADPEGDNENRKEDGSGNNFGSRNAMKGQIYNVPSIRPNISFQVSPADEKYRYDPSKLTRNPSNPLLGSKGTSHISERQEEIGEEDEQEVATEEDEHQDDEQQSESLFNQDKGKRASSSFLVSSPLGEISELEEEETEESEAGLTPTPSQPPQKTELIPSLSGSRSRIKLSSFFNRENISNESRPENVKRPLSSSFTSRLFPSMQSIQSRRIAATSANTLSLKTTGQMMSISETEDEEEEEVESSDNTSVQPRSETSYQDRSDETSTPATPRSPVFSMPTTPLPSSSATLWRWPKRPFSPARDKFKEQLHHRPGDNPADHIGRVGKNIFAKRTLGELRRFHQRHSPSIWGKGFGSLSSPLKEITSARLPSLVSDVEATKSPVTTPIPIEQLETINEEDEDDEIGVWSSEEVDLTESGKEDRKSTPPSPSMLKSPSQIIEEIQEGMKVSPEYLTIVGGAAVHRETSPTSPPASLQLRTNPNSSSLAKHNAKPLYETAFTISNNTDDPLRYEILWPAFRFDVSPAYGIVKAKGVTVVKITVLMKHLAVGSRRDDNRDSKKLMGILKGSEKGDADKPLMGRTRIIVLCENGERKEVEVDIVQVKKKAKGEPIVNSKNVRGGQSGSFISRRIDDLIKAARRTSSKMAKSEEKSRSTNKGKAPVKAPTSSNFASTSKSASSVRRSAPTSRSTSPENKKPVTTRKQMASSRTSRPNTPDRSKSERRMSTSPQPVSRARTPDESRQQQIRQLPQRKNYIYIGVPGHVSCPDTNIREENVGIFRIHNPTNKHVTWHLTTATNPFLKRSDTASQQKITDEVFLVMKTSGFLRPGASERVDVSFRPLFVGTYVQTFMLEDSMNSEAAGGLGGVALRLQGDGKYDAASTSRDRRRAPRGTDFEISEREIRIPATKVGKRKSVGIKIGNPTNQLMRIRCKCEALGDAVGTSVLSIPLSSVQIKPKAFMLLPLRFQPKEPGEIRGIVRLQAVGKLEAKVDIIAEGVVDAGPSVDD